MKFDESFLADQERDGKTDAKFNLFRFQDHLVEQIAHISDFFQEGKYGAAFEALQTIYIDTNGFYTKEEKGKLNTAYIKARVEYFKMRVPSSSSSRQTNVSVSGIYMALIDFKMVLMEYLAKHQFLIQTVNKGSAGATGAGL